MYYATEAVTVAVDEVGEQRIIFMSTIVPVKSSSAIETFAARRSEHFVGRPQGGSSKSRVVPRHVTVHEDLDFPTKKLRVPDFQSAVRVI